jgi:thioredoxin 1
MKKVLKFEKDECNPCVLVSDFLTKNNINFEKIDAYNEPEMALKFKIRSVPTTLLVNDDEVLLKVVGYKPDELTMIKNLL